jgi:hypothetical protein
MLTPPKNSFFQLQVFHLPTSNMGRNEYNMAKFQGWVTEFNDQYSSTWNEEPVYGRMDPLSTFQSTRRQISLNFDVVSENAGAAQDNLIEVNKLITFLYPVYRSGERAKSNTLAAAPLLGLRWTNLAADAATGNYLVGYLKGVNYNPSIADGGFINTPDVQLPGGTELITTTGDAGNDTTVIKDEPEATSAINFIPKTLSISLQFTVLHTHLTGWVETDEGFVFGNNKVNGKYPNAYGVVSVEKSADILSNTVDGTAEYINEQIAASQAAAVLKNGS